jgi:hypothetical protein
MGRHGASHKIKYFKVLLYTRSKAKTRCDFGKDQGLARRKGKKERVTPEFGERKEEKILPPNSGRYMHRTVRWCTGLSSEPTVDCANGRQRDQRATRGSGQRIVGVPNSVR